MPLSLESLQILDTIARRGSFAAAAADLGKVPSALTYTVRRLEEDLDVLVFDRRGGRAKLTDAGRVLLEQGRLLLRAADDLECRVREVATGWEVELRIAVDTMISFDRLRSMIEDFHRLGAPTRLRIGTEVLDGCWDAMVDDRADLAIGAAHDAPADALASGRFGVGELGELDFVWCVAPHHPLAQAPEPIASELLREHRAVAIADTSRTLAARPRGLLSGQPTLTVASVEQKVAALVAGLGCGYLPEAHARPHLAAGRLVARRLAEASQSTTPVCYAWRKAGRGKALDWWLARLAVPRVRALLLAGPASAPLPGPPADAPDAQRKPARGRAGS